MRLFTTIVVILCAAGMAFAQTPGTGKVTQLQYPRYGFALHLPSASDKQTVAIPPGQDMFAEAFTGGGMVYAVFVASEKDGVPPAVMLEQTLAMMSMQAPQAAVRRWQANSGQGIVFNGFTFTIPKAAVAMAQEAWIKQAIGSGDGVQAGAISPLPGNSKYAVGVAAMGPKTRESQVDDAVRMMISSLSFPGYNPGAPSAGARFPFNDFGQLSGSGNLFLFSFPFHRRGDFSGRFLLSVILENVSQFGGGKTVKNVGGGKRRFPVISHIQQFVPGKRESFAAFLQMPR